MPGGRPKGSPNVVNVTARERIDKADPIGFLAQFVTKAKVKVAGKTYEPDLDQRKDAAKKLIDKITPDLKAVDVDAKVSVDIAERITKAWDRGRSE